MITDLVAAAALAASTSVVDQPFAAPDGKWMVEYADDACLLHRSFGDATRRITLAFEVPPFAGADADVRTALIVSARSPSPANGAATMTMLPTGKHLAGTYNSYPAGKTRETIVKFSFDQFRPADISTMSQVTFAAANRAPIRLEPKGSVAAVAALDACLRSLVVSWKMDPDEASKVSSPATVTTDEAEWISYEDYPQAAVRDRASGLTKLVFTIDVTGRVSQCLVVKSSGRTDLDEASCRALQQRGRYRPAIGLDGKPMATHKVRQVAWTIPG